MNVKPGIGPGRQGMPTASAQSYTAALQQGTHCSRSVESRGEGAMGNPKNFLRSVHSALMPDYNRAAATYWWGLIVVGAAVTAVAIFEASFRPLPSMLQILAACMASMLAGSFPVPLPGTKSSYSAAEVFIFRALLSVGLDAACLAAAAEAFVASVRTSKRWTSRLVSPAIAALSMGVTGTVFLLAAHALESRQLYGDSTLLGLL